MAFPKLADIQANMGDTAAPPPAPEASASTAAEAAPVTESPTLEPSSDSAEPASSAEATSESTAEAKADAPGPIPYDRFRQKNEEAKHLKDLNGTLQERIKQLEAGQPAPQVENEPKEPEPNPFLNKIKDLAEKAGDEDVASALIAMGEQLEAVRAEASTAKQDAQQMQIQKLVDEYNRKIDTAIGGSSVHDKKSARHHVLKVLNDNPDADIAATIKSFEEYERKLENDVLSRLGVSRPEAEKKAAAAPDPAASLPSRSKTETGTAPVSGSGESLPDKPMTLRDVKKALFSGRRRRR